MTQPQVFTDQTVVEVQQADNTIVVVDAAAAPTRNDIAVGPTNTLTGAGLWVQTFPDGSLTIWVEDGS